MILDEFRIEFIKMATSFIRKAKLEGTDIDNDELCQFIRVSVKLLKDTDKERKKTHNRILELRMQRERFKTDSNDLHKLLSGTPLLIRECLPPFRFPDIGSYLSSVPYANKSKVRLVKYTVQKEIVQDGE